MRKLILQMQTTLDGFVSTGPNDEQAWVTWDLESIRPHVLELLDSCDTILIGRKLAVDYIPYWQKTFTNHHDPMHDIATRIVNAKKIVFSKTLSSAKWDNTVIENGDLTAAVKALKQQDGKDIVVYGGSSFVSALIKEDLIDEFEFYINPVAIGKGEGVFNQIDGFRKLKLKRSDAYNSGILYAVYERAV